MVKMSVPGFALCVFLQLIQLTTARNFCKEDYRRGLKLSITSVFRTQRHNMLSSCLKSCIATASCESFTYISRDRMCLYGGAESEFESTMDLNHVTSPSQWQPIARDDENLIHPCTHSTCQNGSECLVTKTGIVVCINTECTDSPSMANSSSLSLERTVGRTVAIVCNDGFILDGNPQRTCRGNGQWTDVNSVCIECGNVTHYTTYNRARDHCVSTGRQLLQYKNANRALSNVTEGRCVTCPGDLVADQHKRYVEDDCIPDNYYTNYSYCTCHFTTAASGMKIRIQTEFLDLEENYDFLWIFDGENATFPILGEFSGNTAFTLVTSGNEAFMVFMTDFSLTKTGFRLSYTMVPAGIISDTSVSLTPPDIRRFLWLDGYINATNKTFDMPDGTFVNMSTWNISLSETDTRLCYNPFSHSVTTLGDTDYCNTYCETP